MAGFKLGGLGAPTPRNTLNGNQKTSHSLLSSSPRRPRSSPPPAKRQRLDDNTNNHTQAVFVPHLDAPHDEHASRKRSISVTSESQPTLSARSSAARHPQSSVSEFRSMDRHVKCPPKKRPRYKNQKYPEAVDGMPLIEPLESGKEDSEEEVELVTHFAASQKQVAEEPQVHNIDHYKHRFGKRPQHTPAAKKLADMIDKSEQTNKRPKTAGYSPDELAIDDTERIGKAPAKRPPPSPSPSISRKADITPTRFTVSAKNRPGSSKGAATKVSGSDDFESAKGIIQSGLRIVRGVSGRCEYQSPEASDTEPVLLALREVSTILLPVDQAKNISPPHAYLTVNLSKVTCVMQAMERSSKMVCVNQTPDLNNSSGPKLVLEFSSRLDVDRFMHWVTLKRVHMQSINVKICAPGTLEKTFNELFNRAERNTVLRDDDQPKAEDIQLMEHNEATRLQIAQAKSGHTRVPASRPKVKDLMKPSSIPASRPDGDREAIPPTSQRPRVQRPTRAATTSSTFALRESSPESVSPEPDPWTRSNPGWEKNWRNSLVYPATGKSRATVDKDDIHRLDEGQFLNDNLIIFYLRYLQNEVETKRPDLAQRIYFQNTFFYDKLKPTKTSQGINYDSVKAWTSKVDLFTKDFIIVPINEYSHWYVAIIYNAPKLLPSADDSKDQDTHSRDVVTVEDADVENPTNGSPKGATLDDLLSPNGTSIATQNEVISNLSRMSIESPDDLVGMAKQMIDNAGDTERSEPQPIEQDKTIHLIKDSDDSKVDVEQTAPPSGSQGRKKTGKRPSTGPRKYNPDQPKIITLDSLGGSHSPTCSFLRQYLVAELKDKKGIEIPSPGALGTTAKTIPEQTNHCDCGPFVLGYIQQFLQDPDKFVQSLLQHDHAIPWNLDPSVLRNNIRELIFDLQKEQQQREDGQREQKRRAGSSKKNGKTEGRGELPQQTTTGTSRETRNGDSVSGKPTTKQSTPGKERNTAGDGSGSKVPVSQQHKGHNDGAGMVQSINKRPFEKKGSAIPAKQESTTDSMTVAVPRESRSPPESRHAQYMPGSFPVSPVRVNGNKKDVPPSADVDSGEENKKTFLEPLESSRGSTPTNPMLVTDSEDMSHGMAQKASGSPTHRQHKKLAVEVHLPSRQHNKGHPEPKAEKRSWNEVSNASPILGDEFDTKRETHGRESGPATKADAQRIESDLTQRADSNLSPYFAGLQPGDKRPSAKLRKEPQERDIIDLSD